MLGLFFPIYITQLEFKSREELQLMPQTAEEHLIALEDENEDSESEHGAPPGPDVEVPILWILIFNGRFKEALVVTVISSLIFYPTLNSLVEFISQTVMVHINNKLSVNIN